MLIRDVNGRIVIISRSECRNEKVYYEKLYNVCLPYTKKYKSIFVNSPKENILSKKQIFSKDLSDD
jgi:hypothetical protein